MKKESQGSWGETAVIAFVAVMLVMSLVIASKLIAGKAQSTDEAVTAARSRVLQTVEHDEHWFVVLDIRTAIIHHPGCPKCNPEAGTETLPRK